MKKQSKFILPLLLVTMLSSCSFGETTETDKPNQNPPTPETHVIKYYVEDVFYKSSIIKADAPLTLPQEPTKDKYEFDGWYFDNETFENKLTTNYFIGKQITQDYFVYAKFDRTEFTITYFDGDEAISSSILNNVDPLEFPSEPTKPGFEFAGWYFDNETFSNKLNPNYFIGRKLSSDYSVFAKFIRTSFVLTYSVDGIDYKTDTIINNSIISFPTNPEKTGYSFDGWYFDENVWNKKLTSDYFVGKGIQEDTKVYARFTLDVFKLNYIVDGQVYTSQDIYYGVELTFPEDPQKENYIFAGWFLDNDVFTKELSTTHFKDKVLSSNQNVYAKFVKEAKTITFYSNGEVYKTSVISEINPIILPTKPTKNGYDFEGWYFDNNTWLEPLNTKQFVGQDITKNYSVYAHFEANLGVAIWAGSYHFGGSNGRQAVLDLLAAGVNTIINVNHMFNGNEQEFNSFCDFCTEKGMNLIVDPRDFANGDFVPWDGTCPSYLSKPSVIGLLGQDEPGYNELNGLGTVKRKFDLDPLSSGKLFFLNLRSYSFVTSADGVSYNKYLDAVFSKINPSMVSVDAYPLLESGEVFIDYYQTLAYCSYYAKSKNVPFYWNTCCAKHNSTSGPLAMPTVDNMNWSSYSGLSYGATNLIYYTYTSHTEEYTCIANTNGQKLSLWNAFETATKKLHAYEGIYQSYNYLGSNIYSQGASNKLLSEVSNTFTESINKYGTVESISTSGGDLLTGMFKNKYNNHIGLRVTNAGDYTSYSGHSSRYSFAMNKIDTVTIKLSDHNIKGAKLIINGELIEQKITSDTLTFPLNSYSSAFIEFIY